MAYNDKTTLMMFSGGLDSFLSTCRIIMDGYNVDMISYDNGAMYNIDNIENEANRIIKSYPNIYPYQLNCLCCHTAMHLYSLAYCIAFGIKHMADGARKSQGFIVEMPEMIT